MYRLKKIICFLIVLVMLITMIPMETLAKEIELSKTGAISIQYAPGVYEMGDGYAVIWVTSTAGTGYIKYTYGGKEYTVYDMKNGVIRTNDTVHVVKVPYEHLSGNSYTVYSTEVTSHSYATTNYGSTVSKGPYKLKAYDNKPNDFDVLVLTDTHNQLAWTKTVASQFTDDPDLVVFSGDIADTLDSKSNIELMFNLMGNATGGKYPIVYCRGNHETRGAFSTMLLEYFPTKTGEFYFDFKYGPMWGVVMDTGEDKADAHKYYGNLANYSEYRLKQEAWLRTLRLDETAQYRVGIFHIGRLGDLDGNSKAPAGQEGPEIDYRDSIKHLGLQFGITGHFHKCYIYDDPNSCKELFTSIVAGGYEGNVAAMVEFNNNYAYVTAKDKSGNIYTYTGSSSSYTPMTFNRQAIKLTSVIGEIPEPLDEPVNGEFDFDRFEPTTTSKGTVSIINTPAVFETGGDWYNIVWETSVTDSTALGCTGYVEYEYNGKTYQVMDDVGGYARSYSKTLHTVKVPKEHLNNNKYRVGSFLVMRAYDNATAKTNPHYAPGDYVESPYYVFEDRSEDKAVNLIVCPDIRIEESTKNSLNKVKATIDALGTSPAYIIMNGDAVNAQMNNDSEIAKFVRAASMVSGGIHPIIFSRGESECRGKRATDLMRYFPTVTGELYYSVDMGDYTLVNLDTAEDEPDDMNSGQKYGGRVDFDSLRQEQLDWINSMDSSKKKIVISHLPLSRVESLFGIDYETPLKEKGAVIALSGHTFSYSTSDTISSDDIYNVTAGGYDYRNGNYNKVSVLVSDNYAHINSVDCNSSGTVSVNERKTVDLTTGKKVSYSAEEPEKIDGVYVVSKPEHLVWMSDNCTATDSFSGETFMMANDIDMKLVPFNPIGGNDSNSKDNNTVSAAFAGTFDGNRYEIKNINIDTSNNNVGFFGAVRGGKIKNLTLSAGMVDGGLYVGGLAGYTYGATIENCYNNATVYSASGSKIGGVVGFLSYGTKVDSCANYGNVSMHLTSGITGGVAGQVYSSSTHNQILNSYNRGNIIAHGTSAIAGGIFGYAGNVLVTIENSYNAASVTCPGTQGSIVGSYDGSGKLAIYNSYFTSGFNGATTATKNSNSWKSSSGSGTISSLSQATMKSLATAQKLNADCFTYDASVNDGYPVHMNIFLDPERVPGQEPLTIILTENSKYTLEDGLLKGVTSSTTVDDIRSNIANESGIAISGVATGGTITLIVDGEVVDTVSIVVLGDVDGNGQVDTTDYVRINGAILGIRALENEFFAAADIDKSGYLTSSDLSRVKSHFIRTSSLYA